MTRIDPNHPLTVAARYVNSYAEEHGIEATIKWLDMDLSVDQLMYLAEQRSFRVIYAAMGINLNPTKFTPLHISAEHKNLFRYLIMAYLDGLCIGWKGHEIASKKEI